MLRLSSDWLLGGIFSKTLADAFRYFRLWRNKKKKNQKLNKWICVTILSKQLLILVNTCKRHSKLNPFVPQVKWPLNVSNLEGDQCFF